MYKHILLRIKLNYLYNNRWVNKMNKNNIIVNYNIEDDGGEDFAV
jgi:hypothetical protein